MFHDAVGIGFDDFAGQGPPEPSNQRLRQTGTRMVEAELQRVAIERFQADNF